MKARYIKHTLNFKRPSGTSRGVLHKKDSWFLIITDEDNKGVGECSLLQGLSVDDTPRYEDKLKWVCNHIEMGEDLLRKELRDYPSILFGVETAFQSLHSENTFELFPSAFTRGTSSIPINGLVWMGEKDFMKQQIIQKIQEGFSCIKLKIGAIDFQQELNLLKFIRREFSSEEIEIRVDANGAFKPLEALQKLQSLSEFEIHSIEQPIKQGNWEQMAELCLHSPLPIALDEELIGVVDLSAKKELLQTINPQYLICKPSLIGGFQGTKEWIELCKNNETGWWVTSALESNIGLNAISQWTYIQNSPLPQGLGTGGLYTNNIFSPLFVKNGTINYDPGISWKFNL